MLRHFVVIFCCLPGILISLSANTEEYSLTEVSPPDPSVALSAVTDSCHQDTGKIPWADPSLCLWVKLVV